METREERRVITGTETDNAVKMGKINFGEVSRTHHFGVVINVTSLIPTEEEIIERMHLP